MVIMLPLAVLARGFYRRKKEGCYSEAVKNALLAEGQCTVGRLAVIRIAQRRQTRQQADCQEGSHVG